MSHSEELLERIRARTARVGVIGLGYVGLPLALLFEEAGFPVIGFDVDAAKPEALHRGESYIRHIGAERVAAAFGRGRLVATTDFDRLGECDAILICVPTPLGQHREPDLSFIRSTTARGGRAAAPGPAGRARVDHLPRHDARGARAPASRLAGSRAAEDFFLAFSPEREDPGNPSFHTQNIPKVVGGLDPASHELATALYGAAVATVVPVSSPEVAEAAKLLENIFRAVNIALANEMKLVLDRMGINVWEVIEAAKTKPFGFMPFYPGPGLGGHCIPLDPFYLTWKAAEHGVWARFIELAGEINTAMPEYVVERTARALNRHGKSLKGARVLVLGLSLQGGHRRRPRVAVLRDHRAAARGGGGGRLLRPVHPGGPPRTRPRHRPLVGALHRRGVRAPRRPRGVDGPLGLQGSRRCTRTPSWSSTPAT